MSAKQLLFAFLMGMISSFAIGDGAIEINQSCVDVSCFNGEDPGFPINIHSPGLYRLTSNLSLSSIERAFIIETSNVTFDMNGFTIKGSFFCDGSLPLCSPESGEAGFLIDDDLVNITIRNGRFDGMGFVAIAGNRIQNLKIQDVEIINSDSGFSLSGDGHGVIERVQVSRVKRRGGNVGPGFIVRDSLFVNNGQQGLLGGYCSRNVFRDNGDITGSPEQACDELVDANYCNNLPC